jgi:aspartate 1-decarboxylase
MKLREICKSKIHRATITAADLHYVGSIGIDKTLMQLTNIIPGEKVAIWNINNGERIETYVIPLEGDSGEVVVNGAAARHFQAGDTVIIVAFCLTDEPVTAKMIMVDKKNRFAKDLPSHHEALSLEP